MTKMKVKKGDKVVVLTGKDKGKTGEVLKAIPADNRVIVAGVNMAKKHEKPSQTSQGGIREFEASIHASNVALVDPKRATVAMQSATSSCQKRLNFNHISAIDPPENCDI